MRLTGFLGEYFIFWISFFSTPKDCHDFHLNLFEAVIDNHEIHWVYVGTATKQNIGYLQHQRYGMRLDNWVSWQSQNEDIEIDLTFSSIFLKNETLGHPIFGKKTPLQLDIS